MYDGTTACINGMKSFFEVRVGCRQRGQESSCLFNLYFDFVLKISAFEIDKEFPDGWAIGFRYNIPTECTNREQRKEAKQNGVEIIKWILYADDLVLFSKNVKESQQILTIICDTCRRYGLNVSLKKTKTHVFGEQHIAEKSSLLNINGVDIENVRDFVYLGHTITNREDGCFTDHRTSSAVGKFHELKEVLKDHDVYMKTRKKVLEACVRSRLLNGTQAWFPN
ncbi:uncharacterized protein [Antedon mediterranea]|uniref:uncharacterized protein n=1 Tax=Antedon mediterranea TaxID=105859 RepID=UPI003AF6E816